MRGIGRGAGLVVLIVLSTVANATPPTSVTIAGDLQTELGCAADGDPACAATRLTYDPNSDVWKGTFALPAGSYNFKAALNDSWTENYGLHAPAPLLAPFRVHRARPRDRSSPRRQRPRGSRPILPAQPRQPRPPTMDAELTDRHASIPRIVDVAQ